MNPGTPSQPMTLEPELAAVLARLRACAAFDGLTLTELLEDVADDLEVQQANEAPQ